MTNPGPATTNTSTLTKTPKTSGGYQTGQSILDFISFYGAAPVAQQDPSIGFVQQLVNLGLVPAGTVGSQVVAYETSNETLTALQNGSTLSNYGASGSVTLTLPPSSLGMEFSGYVAVDQPLVFLAQGADVISNGGDVGAEAGNIQSTTVGDYITLQCLAPNKWCCIKLVGDWSLT